jgi:hypothetical protein
MQQNPGNSGSFGNRLASYVAVERKKAIVAACLILIMGFMWIKLLTGKGQPTAAVADTADTTVAQVEARPAASNVTYTTLPLVAGRNDTLMNDFFSPGDWTAFFSSTGGQQSYSTTGSGQQSGNELRSQTIRQIAEGLKLQIMEIGTEPQAFLSVTLVKEGSTLTIVAGETSFNFKVLSISRKMVTVTCENMTFEVKLKEQ